MIAILGCGEADVPCRQVRTLDTRYESRASCTAATEAAVAANSDVDYPVVVAQCVAAGEAPAKVAPGEIRLPPAGRVPASDAPVRPRRS